jgi:membrane associated rhomboid family serine protease
MMRGMSTPVPARRLGPGFDPGGGPPIWRTRYWSATQWTIVVTCLVSVIDMFLLGWLSRYGALSLADVKRGFVWQILTYQLLHAGLLHLIINMLWLFMIGRVIEPVLGKQRFILIYVLSGCLGGAFFLLAQKFGVGGISPVAQLVGASGSILGITAAATCVYPRLPIRFFFPPITVHLWILFVIAVVTALLVVRTAGDNAGGEAAHLGGAVAGLLAFKFRSSLGVPFFKKRSRFWKPGDPASNFFRNVQD